MAECHFWANVMLRHGHAWASSASPTQKPQGLRVVCSKKFQWLFFCFLGHLVGGQLFDLFARETNLKKKSSVMSRLVINIFKCFKNVILLIFDSIFRSCLSIITV